MNTILGNGISIRGGKSRAGARISTTLNDDGTQNVFIEDNVNTIIDTAKSIFSVSYNKVLVPLVGGSTPSGKLEFTYTGEYNERDDGVVELLTSGDITFSNSQTIDIFCVGGGGAGGSVKSTRSTDLSSGGGGSGFTSTALNQSVKGKYTIAIGSGGTPVEGTDGGNGGVTSFGDILTASGGKGGKGGMLSSDAAFGGGNGGSGGGDSNNSSISGTSQGNGGSDGGNGSGKTPGTGQGTTTREFGEATGKLYAGGGAGGTYCTSTYINAATGGEGGGGNGGRWVSGGPYTTPTAGTDNTGGGGGGYALEGSGSRMGAAGGSGIVCIRLHKGDEPSSNIPLSGDLAVGNLVTFDDKSWRVVHNDGTKWYLASENIIENAVAFGSSPTYVGSTLAGKCTTYLSNMSELAQKYMTDVTVNNVTAKVFVPSYEQVTGAFTYYNSNSSRICAYNGSNLAWWTSSIDNSGYAYIIIATGATFSITYSSDNCGFRPHICIDTSLSGSATKTSIKAGSYLFNAKVKFPASGDALYQFNITGIPFQYKTSDGTMRDASIMKHTVDGNGSNLVFSNGSTNWTLYNSGNSAGTSGSWTMANNRNVTFTADFECSDDFYDWFMTNATLSS